MLLAYLQYTDFRANLGLSLWRLAIEFFMKKQYVEVRIEYFCTGWYESALDSRRLSRNRRTCRTIIRDVRTVDPIRRGLRRYQTDLPFRVLPSM